MFAEGRAFVGALDEVFIFSRALSQLEIAKVMEDGLVGAQAVDAKDKIATLWGRIKILILSLCSRYNTGALKKGTV